MPDNFRPIIEEKQLNVQNNVQAQEGTLTKLQREADLLRGGIADGVLHRLSNPSEVLVDSGIAFAGAYALKTALNAGGRWGTAAKIVGGICAVGAGADVARRTAPTLGAIADTWKSGNNFDQNRLTVANNLGTALVDYPTMALAGYAGFKSAGSPKLDNFVFRESHPRNMREVTLEPGKINSPKSFNINDHVALKPAIGNLNIKMSNSYPIFPVVPVDLKSNLELLKLQKPDEKFEGLHKFFKADIEANRAQRIAEAANETNNAQPPAEAAALGAVIGGAAAAGEKLKEAAAPKLEQAPHPREILQIEPLNIQKLMEKIPQKPQAYIEMHRIERK